ncbi:rod shape-determining protein [Sporosarcina sp. GW1-11]|uniref:rod shape-determining protein n=1 Tax=Sporosarcina sp. GW1-11 TaxID=2899126 RepID=UPI00294EC6A1|nr:rod shape-determining protein [Sporosarcina sp. GW1-11]MDV6378255.1 rod shape-determining protein [Sporosarcina sp. GW1-11]
MFSKDIGIDLGTANLLIYVKGKGIIVNEPAVVAIDKNTKKNIAFGQEAYEMIGRTPENIEVLYPMQDGFIADFELTRAMLSHFLDLVLGKSLLSRLRIVICCPAHTTRVEQNVIRQVVELSGGKQIHIEVEPKVAAIGAGIDSSQPLGHMMIDIGAGTTDATVLSMGDIVSFESIRTAGKEFDRQIIQHIKKHHHMYIGERTAEQVKKEIGLALPSDGKPSSMQIHGRDLGTGFPKTLTVTAEEVNKALHTPIRKIVHTAKAALEKTPPELVTDIMDHGIILIGGGALLPGIDTLLAKELNAPVFIAENPLTCLAIGAGILLETTGKTPIRTR